MGKTTPAAPEQFRPPKDHLFRGLFEAPCSTVELELRASGDGTDVGPVMVGHFAVFNQWTEINSLFEGNFLERFASGAFKKTIRENGDAMRALFQHGFDYSVGDKPLGPIDELKEDGEGAYFEVPLLDAAYVRDEILPGLEAGLYGASFRFRVIREDFNEEPGVSDHNPKGLPERTVKEAEVREFGPVTFPAYEGASAGVRSLSDEFLIGRMAQQPERLRQVIDHAPGVGPATSYHSDGPRCEQPKIAGGGTFAIRCGHCDRCREAQIDTTSGSDGGAGEPPTGSENTAAAEAASAASAGGQEAPNDGAGTESHPDRGRSGAQTTPLYGTPSRREKPSWLL
jgi:HK97 family phage prohead protease